MPLIPRKYLVNRLTNSLSRYPVTLLLGPRQCGKTTLARQISTEQVGTYFDLEDPATPLQPQLAGLVLRELRGLVVIDEFQRQPELFPLLRVLADRKPSEAHFLVLGSASLDLVRGVSESLAGRVSYVLMDGFDFREAGFAAMDRLWLRGGFPSSFLAESDPLSFEWRANFAQSFIERDLPQLGIRIPSPTLRRFWTMLAHYHGNVWNAADFAKSLGTKEDTSRRYLDVVCGAFMARQLQPWFVNIRKRLVKAPKVYIRDSGLLHTLLGIHDKPQLLSHPKLGFSWEGFALEQILRLTGAEQDAYFFKTHGGAELDLLLLRNGNRFGFEFKFEDAPRSNKSMHVVFEDLGLEKLWVVYPGDQRYPLKDGMEVIPLAHCPALLEEYGLVRS